MRRGKTQQHKEVMTVTMKRRDDKTTSPTRARVNTEDDDDDDDDGDDDDDDDVAWWLRLMNGTDGRYRNHRSSRDGPG